MINFTEAKVKHLEGIIDLLTNDELGRNRENNTRPLLVAYQDAFKKITDSPDTYLIVGINKEKIIAVAQLNFLHYLTYQGGTRALIEGVRVHQDSRNKGVGKRLFEYLIETSKNNDCHIVQLTTDKSRPSAYKFYENLGFKATHEGFKLHL